MLESSVTDEKLPSPLITIWFHPRQTIHHIIDTNPKLFVIPITLVGGIMMGIMNSYDLASTYCQNNRLIFGDSPYSNTSSTILWGVVEGIAVEFFTLYLAGGVIGWVGNRLGGKAEQVGARAAFAWSSIPLIAASVLFLPYLWMVGKDVLSCKLALYDFTDMNTFLEWYVMVASLVYFGGSIWTFVLRILSISEVHSVSKTKAFIILAVFTTINLILTFFRNYGRTD